MKITSQLFQTHAVICVQKALISSWKLSFDIKRQTLGRLSVRMTQLPTAEHQG